MDEIYWNEKDSFVLKDQYNISVLDIMNILEIYKYLKKSMIEKYVRIMILKSKHKSIYRKLCKMNPNKKYMRICKMRKMKKFMTECEFYLRT